MKEVYEKPEVEVVMFDKNDIVIMMNASSGIDGGEGGLDDLI